MKNIGKQKMGKGGGGLLAILTVPTFVKKNRETEIN